MNTVTQVYTRSFAAKKQNVFRFSVLHGGVIALVLALLLSAFGVVYAKDLNRRLFVQYQNLQRVEQQYQVEWSKLLLEQGTMSTQSRIQMLAQKKLNMVIPSSKNIVLVEDKNKTLADND